MAFSPGWRRTVFAVFLAAYFAYFAWSSLAAHFAPDDMMNLAGYWRPGPWRAVWSQFTLGGAYRPMGALFYLPLFYLFGLNPLPFHVVALAVLAFNVGLFYGLARLLGADETVAGVSAIPMAYHASLAALYFSTAMIYDVLCCFFFLGALVWYLRIRARGELPRGRQLAVFTALYVCALNAKEMAVTLPALLLVYEWLYHPPKDWRSWIWRQNRAALIAIALTAVYMLGHLFGPDPMLSWPAYRPHLGLARAIEFQRRTMGELFYRRGPMRAGPLAVLLIAFTYAAWRRRRPDLRFYWFWTVLTPLPIEFLEGRGGAAMYVPLVGWSLLAGTLLIDLAGAVAAWLSREPLFARLRPPLLRAVLIAAGVAAFVGHTRHVYADVRERIPSLGSTTWSAIRQLRAADIRPRPHDRIVYLNNPFQEWDMIFISELTFRDRTLHFYLQDKAPLPSGEVPTMEHILKFEKDRLVVLK